MVGDSSYKTSFVFALIVHLVLLIFLFVKFTNSKSIAAFSSSNTIINATAINERDFDNLMSKKIIKEKVVPLQEKVVPETIKPQPAPKEIVPVKVVKKNLLTEKARELAELKKERQKRQKNITEQKEKELQKVMQQQVASEKNELKEAQKGVEEQPHGGLASGVMDKHKALIIQAISSNWIIPEGVIPGDFCQLLINVAPGGVVLDVKMLGSSGNLVLERSAQAAVLKASPLPVPEDLKLFDEMRTIKLTFKPEGIVGS